MDILALIQANPVVNDIYQHLAPYLMQAYPYLLRAYPLLHSIYTSLFTNFLHPLYLFTITHIMPLVLPLLEAALKVASQSPGIAVVVGVLAVIWFIFFLMGLMRRMVAWGLRMVFGLVFWGVLGGVAVVVLQRGVGRTGAELVEGGRWVLDVFWSEYMKARREQEMRR
ncbi:uncharacterized protein EAE97_002487 [Botrytis byssoidea]|uniref:Uncharacterized protein n=1 Tax=Botrytis byssoidea TaxID=139641 RepID=A0A9P5IR89_9HELO|nr:uncharacterized protein EAE97_002487 [Botrytis byssoidea]KAF7950935.1 hypothetical protein EAE97_002487 [Botrytis byssoidea]